MENITINNKLAENNDIIRKFMGHDFSGAQNSPTVTQNNGLYHKSWDALMDVIAEINEICDEYDNARIYLESIIGEMTYLCGDVVVCNNKEGVYLEVVSFINKFNEGKFN